MTSGMVQRVVSTHNYVSHPQQFHVPTRPSDVVAVERARLLDAPGPRGPYMQGRALNPEDYAQNTQFEIVERISKSCASMGDAVRIAKRQNPEAFKHAVEVIEKELGGKNELACKALPKLAEELGTSLEKGMASSDVASQRAKYGANELQSAKQDSALKIFLYQFKSFVIILLLVAAVVSLAFGEHAEGIVILIIVFLNASLATYMEKSAGNGEARMTPSLSPG